MTDTLQPNGDQRVTNATIALKIDHMQTRVDELLKKLENLDECQRQDHELIVTVRQRADDNKCEIDRLRSKFDVWNSINSVGTMIAAALGIAVRGP